MYKALIVDIQNTDAGKFPEGNRAFYLERFLDIGMPVHIALTPYQRDQWKDLQEQIGALVTRPGSGLLLEGLLHACTQRNHTIRDPHHEGICTSLFARQATEAEQVDTMNQGITFLEKIFGVRPSGYLPPQHLWNADTLAAARTTGMRYLITNAMFPQMFPYQQGGVTVVPSGSMKHGRADNPVIHAYYDLIKQQAREVAALVGCTIPLADVPLRDKTWHHAFNNAKIWTAKQMRDAQSWMDRDKTRTDPYDLRRERLGQYERHRKQVLGK